MAINFLNSIDLNKNQLVSARIENLSSDPATSESVVGQIYYKTGSGSETLRVLTQTTFGGSPEYAWKDVGGNIELTGDVTGGPGSPSIATTIGDGKVLNVMRAAGSATEGITTDKINTTTLIINSEDFVGGTNSQLASVKAIKEYVDDVVSGNLIFQGGFNADSGLLTSGPEADGVKKLYDGTDTGIAILANQYFIATVQAGDFFGNSEFPLTIGDWVVNASGETIASGTNYASAQDISDDWTIIQQSNELATLTTVGIGNVGAGVASSGIDVVYSQGTASLSIDAGEVSSSASNPAFLLGTDANGATKKFAEADVHSKRGKRIILITSGTGVTLTQTSTRTTYQILLSTAWASGIDARDVTVELTDTTANVTAYAEISRQHTASSDNITIIFTPPITDNTYQVLLQNVG